MHPTDNLQPMNNGGLALELGVMREKYWQFKTFSYTDNMLKFWVFLTLTLFVFFVTVAPYATAMGASTNLAQNPEERSISNSILEEEIINSGTTEIFIDVIVFDYTFPHHLGLQSQNVVHDVLKPPRA
jgi:hypothetical protein